MRIDIAAGLIVDKLTAGGIRATVDPRDLNPPAVWVVLDEATYNKFGPRHIWVGRWQLWAVAGDAGTMQALRTLGVLSDDIRAVFPTITNGQPASLVQPSGGDPWPAIQWTLTLQATDDPAGDLEPSEPIDERSD
jgi:hypothetical protein